MVELGLKLTLFGMDMLKIQAFIIKNKHIEAGINSNFTIKKISNSWRYC